jgi:hypothetical protein
MTDIGALLPRGPVEGVERCSRCDRPWTLTPTRLFTWDFGGGVERICIECREAAYQEMPRCTSCNLPRTDLQSRYEFDPATGYKAVEQYCSPCRAMAAVQQWEREAA